MVVVEIEDIDEIERPPKYSGRTLSFPVHIDDSILDAGMVVRRVYIGNKQIGHIITGGGNWNVIENKGQNKVPFIMLMDAIIYILKEEGYL